MIRRFVLVCLAAGLPALSLAQAPQPAPPAPPPAAVPDSVAPFEKAPHMLPQEYADGPDEWADVPVASDTLTPRPYSEETLARYRADPAFQYTNPRAERPSVFARFLEWLWRTLFAPIGESLGPNGVEFLFIGLAALLLGWAVTWLLRLGGGGSPFAKRDVNRSTGPLLDVDEIAEVDLQTLHATALAQEDYREAIRYRYLLTLQSLDERGLIRWSRHKTNREYVREVGASAQPELAAPFEETTRVFDWVWYGHRSVDRERYEALMPLFEPLDTVRQPVTSR